MSQAQDAIATQKAQREILDEKKSKEIQVIESSVTVEFNIERQHRKELDDKLTKMVEDKYQTLRQEIEKERAMRDESAGQQKIDVQTACNEMITELDNDK